jgi:two-component system cell cycle response regulator DivK
MANELILIVEDNEKNRKLARDVLQFKGYRTIEAETGENGVTLAVEQKPDLILMDYQLPGIDGIEAFRRIRGDASTAHIPIVAVTASAMPEEAKKMKEAGFDGFQTKPLNVKEFVQAVAAVLSGKTAEK